MKIEKHIFDNGTTFSIDPETPEEATLLMEMAESQPMMTTACYMGSGGDRELYRIMFRPRFQIKYTEKEIEEFFKPL